jgi:hypothetical protein
VEYTRKIYEAKGYKLKQGLLTDNFTAPMSIRTGGY